MPVKRITAPEAQRRSRACFIDCGFACLIGCILASSQPVRVLLAGTRLSPSGDPPPRLTQWIVLGETGSLHTLHGPIAIPCSLFVCTFVQFCCARPQKMVWL